MAEVKRLEDAHIVFLYTNIGRGHPHYLDGLVESFSGRYPGKNYFITNIFEISRGLARFLWKLIAQVYRIGSQGGVISQIYSMMRRISGNHNRKSFLASLLGRDIRSYFKKYKGLIVVAHPLLAQMLTDRNRVIYQHGELICPQEARVSGCHRVFVPLEQTAGYFMAGGEKRENLVVTGQGIENEIIPFIESGYHKRLERYQKSDRLVVALFSSGANPGIHIKKLQLAARSLIDAGFEVIVFPGPSQSIQQRWQRLFGECEGRMTIIVANSRAEENRQLGKAWERLDIFMAPAHERTNWAVAAGLPMFILTPHIGTFASLNASIACEKMTAMELGKREDIKGIARDIEKLRESGDLTKMAVNGYYPELIAGFNNGAEFLYELLQNGPDF